MCSRIWTSWVNMSFRWCFTPRNTNPYAVPVCFVTCELCLQIPSNPQFRYIYPHLRAHLYEADKYKFQAVFHMSRNTTPLWKGVETFQGFTFSSFTGTIPDSKAYNFYFFTGINFGFVGGMSGNTFKVFFFLRSLL